MDTLQAMCLRSFGEFSAIFAVKDFHSEACEVFAKLTERGKSASKLAQHRFVSET